MRAFTSVAIIIPFILLIDYFAYRGTLTLFKKDKRQARSLFSWIYWTLSLGFILLFVIFYLNYEHDPSNPDRMQFLMGYNGLFLAQFIPKFVIAFVRMFLDLLKLIQWGIRSARRSEFQENGKSGKGMTRSDFIQRSGIVLAAIPFVGIIHGIGWGRFQFTLHRKQVAIPGLPEAFDGFKIIQLSDAHLGSMSGHQERIAEVFRQINDLNPDIIVFTGDMVNNFAHELNGWVSVWRELRAPFGKFSILGNHDYGNYSEWPSLAAKKRNNQEIIRLEKEMGFRVLLNESVIIEKDDQRFTLAGVENWGRPPFPQFGDLDKVMEQVPEESVCILLSHDPEHFDQIVLGRSNIPLTLSGHTHGFQFGIEIGSFKLSPVQLLYKRWAGLYSEVNQQLYVNRGLGYLAFPGRVGIWPEITLLELTPARV